MDGGDSSRASGGLDPLGVITLYAVREVHRHAMSGPQARTQDLSLAYPVWGYVLIACSDFRTDLLLCVVLSVCQRVSYRFLVNGLPNALF